ncbi:di-trans,poly-cis-decaprenylcistransferase [Pneumocystis carinii B80]|uniref:Di-trans,poly-cis-decaprenylcistransferase n=1 Tax=Pneumocystis carinii (strain B80) TaxID=1408658 RepID=A0A0W4ZCC2_PNEC8|nr:di-trans,poly-cis-decaprenylcistransferase [Pneumocystis carinii B80]KTW25950.1 di-trans,poly-cis-decaprenylcistransferase [Pneumocystis carinii B80]
MRLLQQYIDIEKIDEATLDQHMFTHGCPPLDMLIRTSGVQRLSDFMLWQCHKTTIIKFVNCYWPDFNAWKFLPLILEYQLSIFRFFSKKCFSLKVNVEIGKN